MKTIKIKDLMRGKTLNVRDSEVIGKHLVILLGVFPDDLFSLDFGEVHADAVALGVLVGRLYAAGNFNPDRVKAVGLYPTEAKLLRKIVDNAKQQRFSNLEN
jgi:hypothetical protein